MRHLPLKGKAMLETTLSRIVLRSRFLFRMDQIAQSAKAINAPAIVMRTTLKGHFPPRLKP